MEPGILPDEIVELLAFGDVEPSVDLTEFFAPAFMRKHTRFDDFEEFLAESPWDLERPEDLEGVPTAALDDYVGRTTEFGSWLAMRNAAAERAVVDRLML